MKYVKLISFVTAIILTCYIAYYAIRRNTLAPSEDSTTLIVGTSDDYPPFTFNKDGNIVGFDIDLVKDLAHRMTQKIIIKNMSFDALLLELQRGAIHIIAAGLTPTAERAQRVLFAQPHMDGDPLLIVSLKNHTPITSLETMGGQSIGVNEGYTADFYISKQPSIKVNRLENVAQAMLALKQSKIDAFVTAENAIQPFFDIHEKNDFRVEKLPEITENYALAVSKKYPDLLKRINATLIEMKEDGTIADFKRRWGLK